MNAICVDREATVARQAATVCRDFSDLTEIQVFSDPQEALRWAEDHDADLAVLGTDLPGMRGMTLAEKIRELSPDAEIIILSEDGKYALDAFGIRASGYLVKPVTRAKLAQEIEYAFIARMNHPARSASHVVVQTFGTFELYVNQKMVQFERSRAKELLALLVDQEGDRMRRSEVYAEMWEGANYDRKAQKMLDVIIRSLKKTLTDYHVEHIIEAKDGTLCVVPERLDCDMYRLMAGDRKARNAFHGVYMSSYPWARMTEGYLTQLVNPDQEGERWHGDVDFRNR